MFEEWAGLYDSVYAAKGKDYAAEVRYLLQVMEQIPSFDRVLAATEVNPPNRTPFHWSPGEPAPTPHASRSRSEISTSGTGGANRPPILLDVACGTGQHLAQFRSRFGILGLDRSPEMLAVAQRKLPGANLFLGDMTTFDLGRQCDVVTCLFSSVGYLPSTGALNRAVGRMAAHLRPGGILLLEPPVPIDKVRPPETATLRFQHEGRPWERETGARIEGNRLHIRFCYRPLGYVASPEASRPETNLPTALAQTDPGATGDPERPASHGPGRSVAPTNRSGPSDAFVHSLRVPGGEAPCEIVEEQPIRLFTDREIRSAFEASGLDVDHDPIGPTGLGLYLARR